MEETFKSLEFLGYPNYSVSNLGRVYNHTKNIICHIGTNKQGYYQIGLSYNGAHKTYQVHKLVALAFIPNPDNKPEIDHLNGNHQDNCASNLAWVTHTENMNNLLTKNRLSEFGKRNAPHYWEIMRQKSSNR